MVLTETTRQRKQYLTSHNQRTFEHKIFPVHKLATQFATQFRLRGKRPLGDYF